MAQHPWFENDTKFADIILPTATTFECDDYGVDTNNGQYGMFYFEHQAIAPFGEAKTDYEAVVEVFKKLDRPGSVYEATNAHVCVRIRRFWDSAPRGAFWPQKQLVGASLNVREEA